MPQSRQPEVVETKTVKLAEVKFDASIYPRAKPKTATVEAYVKALRAGDKLPPIIITAEEKPRLLDGRHRCKAYQEIGVEETEAQVVDLHGYPPLLYGATANSIHGDRLTDAEKGTVAEDMAQKSVEAREKKRQRPQEITEADEAFGSLDQTRLARSLHVDEHTMGIWVGPIFAAERHRRDAIFVWLKVLGWTQQEMAEHVQAVGQRRISDILAPFAESAESAKEQTSRGRSIAQIAEAEGVPAKLVRAWLLADLPEMEWRGEGEEKKLVLPHFQALRVGLQPYDVWNFSGCHPEMGAEYPGRIPGELLMHVLYFFTKPGDLVVDPMVGSGTTIDACAFMGRRVYGYDAHPAEGRDDIIQHDMLADGWPEKVAKAKLIFWDPPYYQKKDPQYGDKSISRLGRRDYLQFFAASAKQLHSLCKGRVAFLCSDFNDEQRASENIFYWKYVKLFERAGWKPERRIQVPLTTQSVHPDLVVKFRSARRLARLGRDLVIYGR